MIVLMRLNVAGNDADGKIVKIMFNGKNEVALCRRGVTRRVINAGPVTADALKQA